MKIDEKIESLRAKLRERGLDGWIINGTDPHQSEYVSARWKSRQWISGFTGSAGMVIITMDKAIIWVDSRYFVQCEDQIRGTCFEMRKLDGPEASSPDDFLRDELTAPKRVGISAETLMVNANRNYVGKNIGIAAQDDILDELWQDRPSMPEYPVVRMSDDLCGMTPAEKLDKIREQGHQNGEDYFIISSLDDIAWILNLRGNDIENTQTFMAHLLVGPGKGLENTTLFTPEKRFTEPWDKGLEVKPYDSIAESLSALASCKVRFNPAKINMKLFNALSKAKDVVFSEGVELSTVMKACKNETELEGMRVAHILDGVAMVNFLAMVDRDEYDFTELSIAQALEDERSCEEEYIEPSFSTIAGFREHGAVVHYSATEETDKQITGNGLLVLDSGAQYSCGTTDITRTLLFGKPTMEERRNYTLVLKGHLALSCAVFPKGTSGNQLDILAHQYLWQNGLNYFHGTGHGVGHRLNVHEGPQRISASRTAGSELMPGMVVSNEPGIYIKGRHGIRIENLVAVVPAYENEFGTFYTFETLTCCPYERKLIVKSMLTRAEIQQINEYHQWVYDMLCTMVDKSSLEYLEKATRPL